MPLLLHQQHKLLLEQNQELLQHIPIIKGIYNKPVYTVTVTYLCIDILCDICSINRIRDWLAIITNSGAIAR